MMRAAGRVSNAIACAGIAIGTMDAAIPAWRNSRRLCMARSSWTLLGNSSNTFCCRADCRCCITGDEPGRFRLRAARYGGQVACRATSAPVRYAETDIVNYRIGIAVSMRSLVKSRYGLAAFACVRRRGGGGDVHEGGAAAAHLAATLEPPGAPP